MTTAHDFTLTTLDGHDKKLADYAGNVLLVVNVASKCGYTPQYAGLEALHRELSKQGLRVLGVPCNQFGAQEPGSEQEIRQFCTTKYDVTFDMFKKVDVNGAGAAPFFQWLLKTAEPAGAIKWNFEKFLIGKDGKVIARFGSATKPQDKALVDAIKAALSA